MYLDIIEKLKAADSDKRLELASSFRRKFSSRSKKLYSESRLSERATKMRPSYQEAIREISGEINEYLEMNAKESFRLLEIRSGNNYFTEEVLSRIKNSNYQIEHVTLKDIQSIKDDKFDIILGPITSFYLEDKIAVVEKFKTLLSDDGLIIFCDDFIQPYKNEQQRKVSLIEFHGQILQEIKKRINELKNESSDNSKKQEELEWAAFQEALATIDGILEDSKQKISLMELESITNSFSMLEKKPLFPNDRLDRGVYKILLAHKHLPANPYFVKKLQNGYHEASSGQHYLQTTTLNMIAPANLHPQEVLSASGGDFAETLAEGYRHERYHRGTFNYDNIENIGEIAARTLFKADYVNLNPIVAPKLSKQPY